MSVHIMPKHVWACEDPNITLKRLELPVKIVIFNYPNKQYNEYGKKSPGNNPSWSQCIKDVKYLYRGDLNAKYKDIRYNFLIGPDGAIFEGRGWYREPSLPIRVYDLTSSCFYVALLGDYKVGPPSESLFVTREAFMRYAVQNEYVSPKCLEFTLKCS